MGAGVPNDYSLGTLDKYDGVENGLRLWVLGYPAHGTKTQPGA